MQFENFKIFQLHWPSGKEKSFKRAFCKVADTADTTKICAICIAFLFCASAACWHTREKTQCRNALQTREYQMYHKCMCWALCCWTGWYQLWFLREIRWLHFALQTPGNLAARHLLPQPTLSEHFCLEHLRQTGPGPNLCNGFGSEVQKHWTSFKHCFIRQGDWNLAGMFSAPKSPTAW